MQLRIILKFPSRHSETSFIQLSCEKRNLLLFLTNVMGIFRPCLCGGGVEEDGEGVKKGVGKEREREGCFL